MKIDLAPRMRTEGVEEEGANQKLNFKVPLAMTTRHKRTLLCKRTMPRVTRTLVLKSPPIDVSTLIARGRGAVVGHGELNRSFKSK